MTASPLDVERVRKDFPILSTTMRGKPLVYLDNAASAQKPQRVIEVVERFYAAGYANIHRGVYELSERATVAYEAVRGIAQRFLNAPSEKEIVFVRGTTEAINLVAQTFGRRQVGKGDEILVTGLEHHANIVPWQMLCQETGAQLRVIPLADDGSVRTELLDELLTERTKMVAVSHVSNALGTIVPVKEIIAKAKARGLPVLLDGAQATPHLAVDVQDLGCDFYVFSAHKVFGPSGSGILWGRHELLDAMPPWQGGGDMIESVTFEKTTYAPVPHKFEAGTPNIAGVIGMGAALEYVMEVGQDRMAAHEAALLAEATEKVAALPGVRIIGTAPEKASVLSFVTDCAHPHDIGTILDREGVAIRAGHHCSQPVMDRFGVPATARASFAFYNTSEEIDVFVKALQRVLALFGHG